MAGYNVLTDPLSPGQRIANRLIDLDTRITDLERTRPAISVSTTDPTSTPIAGTMHVNETQGRVWVYSGSRWLSADSQRVYSEDLGTIGGDPADGVYRIYGPSVTFTVPDSGIYLLFAASDIWTPGASSGAVRFHVTGANTWDATVMGSQNSGWVSRETSAGGTIGIPGKDATFGGPGQGGGWLTEIGNPGSTTVQLSYASGVGGGSASFRNRKVYAVTL